MKCFGTFFLARLLSGGGSIISPKNSWRSSDRKLFYKNRRISHSTLKTNIENKNAQKCHFGTKTQV